MNITVIAIGVILFVFLFYFFVQSIIEKEKTASQRSFILLLILPSLFSLLGFFEFPLQPLLSWIFISFSVIALLIYVLPIELKKGDAFTFPTKKVDERDIMFARKDLVVGTERFNEYYSKNPDKKQKDDVFRAKPGLLSPISMKYDSILATSADSSFDAVGNFVSQLNGAVAEEKIEVNREKISNYIKNWCIKLGAERAGITELQDYHLYSHKGRGEEYGNKFVNNHKYAVAILVEMDRDTIRTAPDMPATMESAQQYFNSGQIAIQLGLFIRKLGYSAQAHIDGNYQVICPLVARDAGLGELGRMGLLMTPNLGPRVRIAVVTTDLPIIADEPLNDFSIIDFCDKCKKCADVCPSRSIPFDDRNINDGTYRWQIDSEACYTYWCIAGTDCGRCIAVCPYSHPDNFLHHIVRWGIKRSSIFRYIALKLDDLFYKRKPDSLPLKYWMKEINL